MIPRWAWTGWVPGPRCVQSELVRWGQIWNSRAARGEGGVQSVEMGVKVVFRGVSH